MDATVHVSVALPGLRDAPAGRVTLDVVLATRGVLAVVRLVRVVPAVVVMVTLPNVRDALLVFALELVQSTCEKCCNTITGCMYGNAQG